MSILIIVVCIAFLVVLISYFKVNAFLSFLIVSVLAGLLLGIEVSKISAAVQKGVGDMLGSLVIVVIAGAMLGKLVADSGAAQRISSGLIKIFGEKNLRWALMTTGFIIGIPLFYNVGFVLVFPLIASIVYRYKLPAVYIGLPIMAALSVTHGFLPPHPSPTALVAQFNAHMGTTLLYGFAIAIPTVLIAGLLYSKTLIGINANLIKTFQSEGLPEDKLPGLGNSLFSALLPVIFLTVTTLLNPYVDDTSSFKPILAFLSDPAIVMLISLGVATFSLGISRGTQLKHIMNTYGDAVKDVSMILLIMGGAGGLKQVLLDSGISTEIAALLDGVNAHPLVLGWIIACIIRVCVGSATVAGLTAAGIMIPFIGRPDVDPNLMVLSIGAGSLMFSHVNDAGFWLFKEYFNLSIRDTVKSWSVMETIVAVCGLIGVMVINTFLN
jgi:Gnt-I system high-affinity gluconate transporter